MLVWPAFDYLGCRRLPRSNILEYSEQWNEVARQRFAAAEAGE
jgi:hypothetical protein